MICSPVALAKLWLAIELTDVVVALSLPTVTDNEIPLHASATKDAVAGVAGAVADLAVHVFVPSNTILF